jgi:hypothetical protein
LNGNQLSVYDAGGAVWSTPAVKPDGTLVVATGKGLIMEIAAG